VTVEHLMVVKNGSLNLGQARQRYQKSGVFRLAETLSQAQMRRVREAKSFAVTMRIAAVPSYCNRFYPRRLTIEQTIQNQVVRFQSDSTFGTGA
jgi:hypothetical protein